jgi:hypothetical protein
MYKIIRSLTNIQVISLVITALPIVVLPAQANPQIDKNTAISIPMSVDSPTSNSIPILVAENDRSVRRYGRDKLALETDIDTKSGSAENALAKHLSQNGVKFYGAYWCRYCQYQKALFGQEAVQYLPYIECARDGQNSQTQLCKAKNIKRFPSWEINGKIIPGSRSLKDLAEITGYQGPTNFINK